MNSKVFFSTIEVTRQVFYRSSLSYAIVNLKPIVPGHVLVIPTRPVLRLSELTTTELNSLMCSLQHVGSVVEHAYGADGLTMALQDGKAAGQSMPHVHFHILPRKASGDRFEGRSDDVYPELEISEGALPNDLKEVKTVSGGAEESAAHQPLKVDADENRVPRSIEDMEKEAVWLRGLCTESPNPHEASNA